MAAGDAALTTIAYRDGVMASDSAYNQGSIIGGGQRQKLGHNPKGDLCGSCGISNWCHAFLKWFENGEEGEPPLPDKDKDGYTEGRAMIVRSDGMIEIYENGGGFPVKAEYVAIGSGFELALGAMHAGATAKQAVAAAITHDTHSAGEILTIKHAK